MNRKYKTTIRFKDGGKAEHISADIEEILIQSDSGLEDIKISNGKIEVFRRGNIPVKNVETIPITFTPKQKGSDEET
jgi:hypothetical protein